MKCRLFALSLLIILALSMSPFQVHAQSIGQRAAIIPIKIILVGLDGVDSNYLAWSASSSGNLPVQIPNSVFASGNNTGEVFYPQYTVVKASSGFKQSLVGYLNSIQRSVSGSNPWFHQYNQDKKNADYCTTDPVTVNYVVYDANSVEEWLWTHSQDLGGFTPNGWTIVVSYLPELPSLTIKDYKAFQSTNGRTLPTSQPHYYGISRVDSDLGYRPRYRDFMDAWGGQKGRMWFVDLSAGPVWNSRWDDLPLQIALGDNNIDLTSAFGKQWLTEYVSDYAWQATDNFIAPQFVYYPTYRPNYQVDVFILDDRNAVEKSAIPIQRTVDKGPIVAALQDLVPYSKVSVNINFPDISSTLDQTLKASYKFEDSWTMGTDFCAPERYGVEDVRPAYKYVMDHLGDFEQKPYLSGGTMTIPVFAFAFSGETYFTYSYKWYLGKTNYENGALLGIAMDQAVLISYNQYEFTYGDHVTPAQSGKGEGFTETIIHEVGHEFGLMHPHQFGDIGDFIFSAMGYFTNDYKFGQIDKDAIQRAHVDQLYFATQKMLAQVPSSSASQIQAQLAEVDSAYSKMDYVGAMQKVLPAYQSAQRLVPTGSTTGEQTQESATTPQAVTPTSGDTTLYLAGGIVVGLVVGLAVAMLITKRNKAPPKT
jgi:hypothetical protein